MFPGMQEAMQAFQAFLTEAAAQMGRQTELLEDIRYLLSLPEHMRQDYMKKCLELEASDPIDTSLDQ